MNPKRITRRQALAAGIGAVVSGPVLIAQVQKETKESWVGNIVMPKK
jgi:hypothetical protein